MRVIFEVKATGEIIYKSANAGYINGITPIRNFEREKKRWTGDTIYARSHLATYDAQKGEYGKVSVDFGEPLSVEDVRYGLESTEPIWIFVSTEDDEIGFIPTPYSWTNIPTDWRAEKPPWKIYPVNRVA